MDDAGVRSLATKYHGKPIDVLVNNAGILGDHDGQILGAFSRKGFHDVMDVERADGFHLGRRRSAKAPVLLPHEQGSHEYGPAGARRGP